MSFPLLLSSLLSLAAADSSTVSVVGSNGRPPLTKEEKADSAWTREPWSVEVSYRNAIAWGDLRDGEDDMADKIGLTIRTGSDTSSPLILLQDYALGLGFWHNLGDRFQVGLGYDHTWSLVVAGQGGLDLLLSADALTARGRIWVFRRLQWQIGPKFGVGAVWADLTRYGIEKGAEPSGDDIEIAQTQEILDAGSRKLSLTGWRLEAGLAMEVRILPQFSIGGALQAMRQSMTFADDDPIEGVLRGSGIPYPSEPVQWEAGLEFHAAYRF